MSSPSHRFGSMHVVPESDVRPPSGSPDVPEELPELEPPELEPVVPLELVVPLASVPESVVPLGDRPARSSDPDPHAMGATDVQAVTATNARAVRDESCMSY